MTDSINRIYIVAYIRSKGVCVCVHVCVHERMHVSVCKFTAASFSHMQMKASAQR